VPIYWQTEAQDKVLASLTSNLMICDSDSSCMAGQHLSVKTRCHLEKGPVAWDWANLGIKRQGTITSEGIWYSCHCVFLGDGNKRHLWRGRRSDKDVLRSSCSREFRLWSSWWLVAPLSLVRSEPLTWGLLWRLRVLNPWPKCILGLLSCLLAMCDLLLVRT
jgi:hypothetical protein